MAIGEWTDGREFWFFQALVESAKLDAGMENQHNILVQGPFLSFPVTHGMRAAVLTDVATTFNDLRLEDDTSGTFEFVQAAGTDNLFYRSEVTFRLYDRCPWNRIVFGIYVKSVADGSSAAGTARIELDRRPATFPRTRVNLYQLLASGFTSAGWYGSVISIGGLNAEQLTLSLRIQANQLAGAAQVKFGSPFVQLASTVAGVS